MPKKRKRGIAQTEGSRSNVAHLVAHPMKTAAIFSDAENPSACRDGLQYWPDDGNREIEDDGFITIYF